MMVWILLAVFIVLTITVGGDRTAKTSVTTGINGFILILAVFAIYLGLPPLLVALVASGMIMYSTIFFQNDRNVKTEAAFLSVGIIVILTMIMVVIFVYKGNLGGFPVLGEHRIRLSNGYKANLGINMAMLQVSVILIALIGAVIDTAVAVTSGVYEVKRNNPDLDKRELFQSGMRIGREIISSTVNTLFFIFAGEYLVMFVNFSMFYSMADMINSKEFAQGAISILISAIGCMLIIPIASYLSGVMYTKKDIDNWENIEKGEGNSSRASIS